jgi:hypothetical protein
MSYACAHIAKRTSFLINASAANNDPHKHICGKFKMRKCAAASAPPVV